MLDIIPPELNADEKAKGLTLESPAVRNRVVLAGLEAAKKSKPAAFVTPETSRLITPGNLDDNLAWVMAGGGITAPQTVSEQYILDLEAFVSLCGERKTQERIAHTLKTGKPLRN